MKLDINVAAEQFKKQLIDIINQAGTTLPPVLINYIVRDVYQDVNQTYNTILKDMSVQQIESENEDKQD